MTSLGDKIANSNVSVFKSTSNTNIYWYGSDEVNFFLYEIKTLPHIQYSYMNDYTIYGSGTAQKKYCPSFVSTDFWAFNQSYCGSGYTFQFALSPTITNTKDCYLMSQNYTAQSIITRYVNHGLFGNCNSINGVAFSEVIIKYWDWADASYKFDTNLLTILMNMNSGFEATNVLIKEIIITIDDYYNALDTSYTDLQNLQSKIQLYYSTMNCTMINSLTSQLYVGFCGQVLEYLFNLAIFCAALGTCNLFFSIGIVLFIFRHRTDLEIEQERILRSIGRRISIDSSKENESTQRAEDTIINKY